MDERLKALLGWDTPYPVPKESFEEFIDVYYTAEMALLFPKTPLCLPVGVHGHDSFEFTVPISLSPLLTLGKKKITVEKNRLFAFNPEQEHGPACEMEKVHFLGLQVDREFLREISRSIFGKADFSFCNENARYGYDLQHLFQWFMLEFRNRQAGYEFILETLCTQIVICLIRSIRSDLPRAATERNYSEKDNIGRVEEFLRENYGNEFSLKNIARVANLSPYHLIRSFKSQTGKTPYQYLLEIKVEKAKELLRFKELSITEICFRSGFNNPNHFTDVFKRKVGVLSSEYRRELLK